jgi:hypothetical protein
MARTRADLGRKLEMLKTHVLGDVTPQTHGDIKTMAAKKSAKSAKTSASKTPSRKSSASRASAKKTAGKKAAGAKSAAARSAKKKPARRSRSNPLLKKAKKVMGDVLAGAAAGAVAGALEAAIPMEQHAAAKLEGHEAQLQ